MFQFFKKIFNKKNKSDMITEEQIINYKQNFTGQSFQWVKPENPNLLGKVVKCRDIDVYGSRVMAIFDDGSKVDVQNLNRNLFMVHADMPPLTIAEIESIYPSNSSKPQPTAQPHVQIQSNSSANSQPVNNPTQQSNPFEMFNSDLCELNLKVNVKLPDRKLLKLMYNNAEDKQTFIDQLSEYVMGMINNNVIQDSMRQILDPGFKHSKPSNSKKEDGTEIKLTEVK
jgi:hypothetical protein